MDEKLPNQIAGPAKRAVTDFIDQRAKLDEGYLESAERVAMTGPRSFQLGNNGTAQRELRRWGLGTGGAS